MGRFTELEDKLYLSIDSMLRASLPVPSTLAILKAKKIAEQLSISQDDSKHLGSGSASLENAVDYNNYFFTVKEQR